MLNSSKHPMKIKLIRVILILIAATLLFLGYDQTTKVDSDKQTYYDKREKTVTDLRKAIDKNDQNFAAVERAAKSEYEAYRLSSHMTQDLSGRLICHLENFRTRTRTRNRNITIGIVGGTVLLVLALLPYRRAKPSTPADT